MTFLPNRSALTHYPDTALPEPPDVPTQLFRQTGNFSRSLILGLVIAGLTGCSQTDSNPTVPDEPAPGDIPGTTLCTEPRPEICTQQYDPVCGVHEDGTRRTYSNACMACGDADVVSWLPGACHVAGDEAR
jgi:hypothetical protein